MPTLGEARPNPSPRPRQTTEHRCATYLAKILARLVAPFVDALAPIFLRYGQSRIISCLLVDPGSTKSKIRRRSLPFALNHIIPSKSS